MAYTGCRFGEVRDVLWTDIDFERGASGFVLISKGGSAGKTKDKESRRIPIHPELKSALLPLPRIGDRVFHGIPFLLSNLLRSKQDGGAEFLVGHSSGSPGKKVRNYRHKRGHRDSIKASPFNKLIPAEPLEQQLLSILSAILMDAPRLHDRIEQIVVEQQSAIPTPQSLEELRDRR